MKIRLILTIMLVAALTGCASMKRQVYIVPSVSQDTVIDEDNKITKVYYSQKYYDSAIKITPDNAREKLQSVKLPAPVLISGMVKGSIDYDSRASMGKLRGINFLGEEYKGAYMFNGASMFVAKFPLGSQDYSNGFNFRENPNVNNLFCIASETQGRDINLLAQDMLWLAMPDSHGNKTKLSPVLTRKNKTSDGKSIYIDFKDCAFVKFE